MSLLFNMLPMFVMPFLPRSKCLLISWLQSPSTVILEPKKIVCQCFHCFPIYLPWSEGLLAISRTTQVTKELAVEPWETPGLVLAHWWEELASELGGCGTRGPETRVGLLVGGSAFWHYWLHDLVCPKTDNSSWVGRSWSLCVWIGTGYLGASVSLMVDRD